MLLITSSKLDQINHLKKLLSTDVKDLGDLRYFLGIEVARSSKGIFLCQRKYVIDLLHETKMTNAKHFNLPMEIHLNIENAGPLLSNPH